MYYLTVWRPRSKINVVGLKIKVSAEVYSFWRLQGKICFLAFSSFQSLSAFLSFHPLPYGSPISPSIVLCPTPTLSFVPPYKNLCYYIKSTWIIQASLPSSKYLIQNSLSRDFPGGSDSKESPMQCRRRGFDPESGRSPGGRHGNPLQYPCLENSMDRRVWWATVHGVAKNWTDYHFSLSLVVQWLRLYIPNVGGPGSIPDQGTRSHLLQLKIPHRQ